MKVIPETCRGHWINYLCVFIYVSIHYEIKIS